MGKHKQVADLRELALETLLTARKKATQASDVEGLLNIGITFLEFADKINGEEPRNKKPKHRLGFHNTAVEADDE